MSSGFRTDALLKMAVAAALCALPLAAYPQTTQPATAPAADATPATAPATAPASAPSMSYTPGPTTAPAAAPIIPAPVTATPTPASTPAPSAPTPSANGEAAAVTQPFIGTVISDKVYVRSGPGTAYYDLGQLGKGDQVYIVGASRGWYEILPPNGTFCMIAKEMVTANVGADGTGTAVVGKDYVNLRAGTAVSKNRDPSAVLAVLRKGTQLRVLGATDQYYEVAPTEQAYVFISPQFIKPADVAEYKVPDLKLPAGATGPTQTVQAPTAPPQLAGTGAPSTGGAPAATAPSETPSTGGTTASTDTVAPETPTATAPAPLPPIPPAVTYSKEASEKFKDTQARYADQIKKPLPDQDVEGLKKEFQDILAMDNISPSVKSGAQADSDAIDRTLTLQRLMKEQAAAQENTQKQSDALQQQYEAAQRAIAEARESGPFVAQGLLQTSAIVTGKYALVSPDTGRVVAYVDPASSSVDIGSLVGKYIGVRGISKMQDSDITLIEVNNATLMPNPVPATMPK